MEIKPKWKNLTKFEKFVGYGNVLFHTIQEGEYRINKVFP